MGTGRVQTSHMQAQAPPQSHLSVTPWTLPDEGTPVILNYMYTSPWCCSRFLLQESTWYSWSQWRGSAHDRGGTSRRHSHSGWLGYAGPASQYTRYRMDGHMRIHPTISAWVRVCVCVCVCVCERERDMGTYCHSNVSNVIYVKTCPQCYRSH